MLTRSLVVLFALGCCLLPVGCENQPGEMPAGGDLSHADVHDHPVEHAHVAGPHGGHLVVLGEEEYHAELIHDEATHMVGVYLLGPAAEQPVATDAKEITLQLFRDGDFVDYTLSASQEEGKFSVEDESLCDFLLHAEQAKGRIRAVVGDREYVGIVDHHAHAHAGHEGHDHSQEGPHHDQTAHAHEGDDAGHHHASP